MIMNLFYFHSPAHSVRQLAPLNTGQIVVKLLRHLADLPVIDHHDLITPLQLADGRYDRGGAASKSFLQLAFLISLIQLVNGQLSFRYLISGNGKKAGH